MKQTSIDKLSKVYNFLQDEMQPGMAELIAEVIRAESAKPKGEKFDYYKFTPPKKAYYREALKGVYHDSGWKVASDAHIMVALKEEYPEELEGKIVAEDGSFIDATYPAWQKIMPKKPSKDAHKIDVAGFREWLADRRVQYKAEYGKGTKYDDHWDVCVGGVYFRAWLFDLLITAMEKIGADTLLLEGSHPAYCETEKGKVVVMPLVLDNVEIANDKIYNMA